MKIKLSTILAVLVIAMLTISTADAGPGIKISANNWSLSSLVVDGFLRGSVRTTVTLVLEATGTCTADGETFKVSAIGSQTLYSGEKEADLRTNDNNRPFHIETTFQNPLFCNNIQNPEAQDGFVLWTHSSISVYSGYVNVCQLSDLCGEIGIKNSIADGDNGLLATQNYDCTTNPDAYSVDCTPAKNHGSNNNDTVSICHATESKKNPYVLITVNVNGLNGHGTHEGDIIPAPANGCPH